MSILGEVILVTGGSGFVGSHTVSQLLKGGYSHVRTTVRDSAKKERFISSLKSSGVTEEQLKHLQVFLTDLLNDAGWKEAFEGVKFLLHIASPIAAFEKDKVKTASEGTLRVLKFARDGGVKRAVVTSSGLTFMPLMKGSPIADYHESKIVADNAVWDFLGKEGANLELISIHPAIILGPVLGADNARQVFFISDLLTGKTNPMTASGGRVFYVDVRDVADLHIRALTADPATVGPLGKGQGKVRLLANAEEKATWAQVSQILRDKLPAEYAKNVAVIAPPPDTPNPFPEGDISLSKALGWKTHTTEETMLDTANSLIALGLVKQ